MKLIFKVLIVQILTIPIIVMLFKLIGDPLYGGAVASSIFVIQYLWSLGCLKKLYKTTIGFWFMLANFMVVVLPLAVTRLINWPVDFSTYSIWGIEGPSFHKLSEKLYMVVVLALVVDLLWLFWKSKRAKVKA